VSELLRSIRDHATDLGFSLFGVAPADPLEGAEFYARWVALGYAGEMAYLERNRDKRQHPARLVPGARSVICVGMHYPPAAAHAPSNSNPLTGQLSCYALGDDYHQVMKSKLAQLFDYMQKTIQQPLQGRYYVDTAPVLERELAQLAGLGWWGKNTCLIDKRSGSYFFLGEIISDLELPFDEPAVDHCGTCTRCLDACPTDAFPEPYVLDARRCISYLTIELKGSIPQPLRADMGNWILGCDVCQQVCPWNREAPAGAREAFQPRAELDAPALADLIRLDRHSFNALFKGHAAKRPKRRGLLRNVAVALGNSGDRAAVPPLIEALADEEPLVRGHAAWGLGRLGGTSARQALESALAREQCEEVVTEIRDALNGINESAESTEPAD
jgi:epoxyqueuosine reductase